MFLKFHSKNLILWFSYSHNFIIILSRVFNEPIQQPAPSWLVNSIGRVLHRYRRGQGFKSCTSLNLFSGFPFATAKVASITAMIYFHLILHPTVYIYDFHIFLTSRILSFIKPETILIMYLENLSSSFNWSFNICVRTEKFWKFQ